MFADKQTVLNAFRFRHACKSYDAAKKIPADDFAYILETARLSPVRSGWNLGGFWWCRTVLCAKSCAASHGARRKKSWIAAIL